MGKILLKLMQLIYLIEVFEDNYNIACDLFERGSVNVMKNRSRVAKKQRKVQYILACSIHISSIYTSNNMQSVCKPYWFVTIS